MFENKWSFTSKTLPTPICFNGMYRDIFTFTGRRKHRCTETLYFTKHAAVWTQTVQCNSAAPHYTHSADTNIVTGMFVSGLYIVIRSVIYFSIEQHKYSEIPVYREKINFCTPSLVWTTKTGHIISWLHVKMFSFMVHATGSNTWSSLVAVRCTVRLEENISS
jgi:hypothetical protein